MVPSTCCSQVMICRTNFPNQTTLLLGVCFLLIVYVIPAGIVGVIGDAMNRRGKLGGSASGPLQRLRDVFGDAAGADPGDGLAVAAGGVFGHARRWGKDLEDYAHALLQRVG